MEGVVCASVSAGMLILQMLILARRCRPTRGEARGFAMQKFGPVYPVSGGRMGREANAPWRLFPAGFDPLPTARAAMGSCLPASGATTDMGEADEAALTVSNSRVAREAAMAPAGPKLQQQDADPGRSRDPPAGTGGGLPGWIVPFVVPALGGALFGYDIGAASSVLRVLGDGASTLGPLGPVDLGLISSASLLGAVAASAALVGIGDASWLGRRTELIAAACLFGVGTAGQVLAPTLPAELVARAIYGLGIGAAMHAGPLYIAETAPSNLRGQLVSLKEAAIVLGIVLGYVAGAVCGTEGDWQTIFALAVPVEAAMLVAALWIPESPRWLAAQGRKEEAEAAVIRSQGVGAAEARTSVMAMNQVGALSEEEDDVNFIQRARELLSDESNRRALTIGIGLVLLQQLTGQPSVLYYANRIFETAGLGFEAAVGVGVFKLIMTLISVSLVENENYGRKGLLQAGTVGMTVSLGFLSALFALGYGEPGGNSAAIVAAIVGFVGSYQIGFGPVTWLILSEIFPQKVRGTAVSIGTLVNFGSNFLVSTAFEFERQRFGESILFGQFALIGLASCIFVSTMVFETQGLTLEQIEGRLKKDECA